MGIFPDSSNSPAHYARTLYFLDYASIVAACNSLPTWLHQFCHVKELIIGAPGLTDPIRAFLFLFFKCDNSILPTTDITIDKKAR
jgi:hypothetical protein